MKRKLSSEQAGFLLVFFSGVLWGGSGLFVKWIGSLGATPVFSSFCRMAFALPILAGLTLVKFGPQAFRVSRRTLLSCALMGFVCQAAYNFCYSFAVDELGVSVSTVLLYLSPVFTCLFAYFLFREPIGWRKVVALVVNILGCALTVTGGNLAGFTLSVRGLLFALAAALCYSLSAILGRFATANANLYAVGTYNFLFATLFLLFTQPWQGMAGKLSPMLLLAGFLYGLIPTALTYLLYFTGLQKIRETGRVPVIASVETVVATLVGIVFFGETVGLANWLGIALVLCSILLLNSKKDS